jgi:hypothetical protein
MSTLQSPVGPNAPEVAAAHQRVAEAVGGKVFRVVVPAKNDVGGALYTNIIVPR